MEKCSSKDCPHGAKYAPAICVPAMGWPLEQHDHLEAMMLLPLCESCIKEFKADNFLGPEANVNGKNAMREVFTILTKGKVPPDFDRAYIKHVSINSKEYLDMKAAKEKGDKGTVH